MKITVRNLKAIFLFAAILHVNFGLAQTYTTIQSGNWTNSSIWQGGLVPPSTIPPGAQVIINHQVNYNASVSSIINRGTIRIFPVGTTTASLLVPTNINFENRQTGVFLINNGSYLQHRFLGGGNSGVPQSGSFKNIGGRVEILNSYIEVAQDWVNESGGRRTFINGCIMSGQGFNFSSGNSYDTLINSKVSIAWHGSGNFNVSDGQSYYQDVKICISNSGNFEANSGSINGHIQQISLKHPVTGVINNGNISVATAVNTGTGLTIGIYSAQPGNLITNGKISNVPVLNNSVSSNFIDCSIPAGFNPLPVKLISFSAILDNNKVNLKWVTSEEQNASHFVIEKSLDGLNFSDAATVFAMGHTVTKTNYSFSDKLGSMTKGVIYYRLRSVDADGKFEYSATRIIRVDSKAANTVTILTYPNPVTDALKVTIPLEWQNKKVSYELFKLNGQSATKLETLSGSQTETFNVSHLQAGIYFVSVTCEGKSAQQKFIKN